MAQLPPWQPLDGGVPLPDGKGSGRVVAVVASEGADEAGWAPSAALDIARSWSSTGAKVVLADGGLHYPSLHTHAKVENREGLSDAALFGVSVGRVAQPVDGGAFFLITAGTAVANANVVPSSPRWSRLLEGFVEAGVKLILFVRDGDSGAAAFLGSASDIVVLSAKGEKTPAAVRDLEGLVRAVTGPGAPAVRPAAPAAPVSARAPKSAPAGAGSPRAGSPKAGSPKAGPSRAGSPGAAPSRPVSTGPRPPEEWTAKNPAGRQRVLLLVLLVVVVIAALVMVFSSIDFAGAAPEETGAATLPTVEAPAGVA